MGAITRAPRRPGVVLDTGMCARSLLGKREVSWSDLAIVAVKPTNKAGQPTAELVEPRAEAEGNASQQSTGRAQDRGTVSQALERIRQAARQRKKEKFTELFHHVSIYHLT